MQITAVFESWHIGDGNYPPLHRGQLVRLSFELQPAVLTILARPASDSLAGDGDAEYHGVARVLRVYPGRGPNALAVLEAGGLRFYVCGAKAAGLPLGGCVVFAGTLLLDHYIWVEFLDEYEDSPDLFYNLRVDRIRQVAIPERDVVRQELGKAYPTRIAPAAFGDVIDVETMEGQRLDEVFYLLGLDSANLEGVAIPRTFR